jgi:hypothetical protein|tara:strand:+ start:800 stop:979 length:180 start_codon:yes stop_codon:yes gene_type:complete
MKSKKYKPPLNKFKLALFVVGFCGAAFYLTVPVNVISFMLYFGLAALCLPLIWDLIDRW